MATLNVQNYGATGDGSTDDTDAIQAAIDDASAGDTVYLPEPSAYYKIQHTDPANDNGEILRIDGDSEPDNLTVKGDGEATTVRLGSGHENNLQMIRVHINSGITGLEIRDMVLDGDRTNQPQSPGVGPCILARYADAGTGPSDVDILVENVLVKRAVGSGMSMHTGGAVVKNCTADNSGWHGFNTAVKDGAPSTPKTKFQNCLAENCTNTGYYGIDLGGDSNAVVSDTVLKDNRQGTKTVDSTQEAVYRRVRINGTDAAGIQRPNQSDTAGHPITIDDMVIENATNYSIRQAGADSVTLADGSELVVTGMGGGKANDVWFFDNQSLAASNATIYINNSDATGSFLDWGSNNNGTIGDLQDTKNSGGLDNNGNLTIQNRGSTEKTDIDSVPTADEVGAFVTTGGSGSGGGSGGGSTPDPSSSSSREEDPAAENRALRGNYISPEVVGSLFDPTTFVAYRGTYFPVAEPSAPTDGARVYYDSSAGELRYKLPDGSVYRLDATEV